MSLVQAGDRVRIHYTASSLQKSVLEISTNRQPLEFIAGGPEVIPGVSEGVVGMSLGEKRRLVVSPPQAYGHRDPQLEQRAPLSALPEKIQAGDQLAADVGGVQLDVWVRGVENGEALLDANHPLAGMALEFSCKVVGIRWATAAEIANGSADDEGSVIMRVIP